MTTDPIYTEIGRRVRHYRRDRAWTQDALAARTRYTRTSISNLESGRQTLPLHELRHLAQVFGVPLTALLPDEPVYQAPSWTAEIVAERIRQAVRWGGAAHDDTHSAHDWITYLVIYAGRGIVWPLDLPTFRRAMVKVAALAVAAIEWADRQMVPSGDQS